MIHYSLETDGKGKVEFWTDNKEMAEDVIRYIRNVVDAVNWRSQIVRLAQMKEQTHEAQ